MLQNRFYILISLLMLCAVTCKAQCVLPDAKMTCIEVAYEQRGNETVHRWHHLEYLQRDAYTGEEKRVGSGRIGNGSFIVRLWLRHPLYDALKEGQRTFPFYVNPGDYLIITARQNGTLEYRMADKSKSRYERLMLYDVSRKQWYDNADFERDRTVPFKQFVNSVVQRMDSAVSEVNAVALTNNFTQEETEIAINNVRMQFGVWLMEYPSWKSVQLALFTKKGDAGWQSLAEHEAQMSEIEDARNYTFLRRLPLNDTTCMASPYFPIFLQSYSHTYALTHDQYLYVGNTPSDLARMDSAMVAHEQAMTRLPYPSVFLQTALLQRQLERQSDVARYMAEQKVDTTNSIILPDVEVLSNTLQMRGMTLSEREQLTMALNNAQIAFNPFAPVFYLIGKYIVAPYKKKHPGKKARARMRRDEILRKYAESDEEFARLVQACEEVQREKAAKKR